MVCGIPNNPNRAINFSDVSYHDEFREHELAKEAASVFLEIGIYRRKGREALRKIPEQLRENYPEPRDDRFPENLPNPQHPLDSQHWPNDVKSREDLLNDLENFLGQMVEWNNKVNDGV